MAKKQFIIKVRKSRKSFFLIYLMVLAIISTLIYLEINGYNVKKSTWISSIIIILGVIKFTEIHRIQNWWAITDSAVIQSLGLLNKNVREVDFSSISDLDIDQPLFKRFLDYGDVNVRLFLNDTSICVRDINNPEGFMEKLQEIIAKNRRANHGLRKT